MIRLGKLEYCTKRTHTKSGKSSPATDGAVVLVVPAEVLLVAVLNVHAMSLGLHVDLRGLVAVVTLGSIQVVVRSRSSNLELALSTPNLGLSLGSAEVSLRGLPLLLDLRTIVGVGRALSLGTTTLEGKLGGLELELRSVVLNFGSLESVSELGALETEFASSGSVLEHGTLDS